MAKPTLTKTKEKVGLSFGVKVTVGVFTLAALAVIITAIKYVAVLNSVVPPTPTENLQPSLLRYAPGMVLVGLKEGASLDNVLSKTGIQAGNSSRIHDIKPVAEKFRKAQKKSTLSDGEAFEEAYKSMPEVERKLYRSHKLKLPKGISVEEAVAKLKKNSDVEYAEPDYIMEIQMVPNDPYYATAGSWGQSYDDLYGLKNIQGAQAWDISQGEGVMVAVIDTGVDYDHKDLAANIWINSGEDINHNGIVDASDFNGIDDDRNGYRDDIRGWDFVNNDNNLTDGNGHGTHCAGTIAAIGNNSIGIIGVAPKAKIMPVKGLSDTGSGVIEDLARAVIYAANNGADILSNSWGGGGNSQALTDAFTYAQSKGCISIAAAGNYNMEVSNFLPANINSVIAVAATDNNDQKASFSNYGSKIDVSAPGVNILSLRAHGTDIYLGTPGYSPGERFVPAYDENANYYRANGTSMACPHVAGLVALLLSKKPNSTPQEIRNALKLGADKFNSDIPVIPSVYIGQGRVNAYKSLLIDEPPTMTELLMLPAKPPFATGSTIEVSGSAMGVNYFLEYADSPYATNWTLIASGSSVQNGILGILNTTPLAKNIDYYLRLRVNTGKGEIFVISDPVWTIDLVIGWPQSVGDIVDSSPAIADLDGDGRSEIVVGCLDGKVYIWHGDGTSMSGWPQATGGEVFSSPAIVDINNDGRLEIVIGGGGGGNGANNKVYAWYSDGTIMPGWPQETGSNIFSSPAIADLNNDGKLEIVTGSYLYKVYAWDYTGNLIPGWPQLTQDPITSGPNIADIDGDGGLEVVITDAGVNKDGKVYAWHSDGTIVAGWPQAAGYYIRKSPAIADLDGDGKLEIIVARDDGKVYAWHSDGTIVAGWPQSVKGYGHSYSSPAIADLDGDGSPEIVAVFNDGIIYAWRSDGIKLPGWPVFLDEFRIYSSPAIADLDGDGRLEVVIGNSDNKKIYAWHSDGTIVAGWPQQTGSGPMFHVSPSSPAIADLDGDGRLEVVIGDAYNRVHALFFDYQTNNKLPWPTYQHDNYRTGHYTPQPFCYTNSDCDAGKECKNGECISAGLPCAASGCFVPTSCGN